MADLTQFDRYLTDDTGDNPPAALVIREHLMPAEGADGVLFPATFAAGDGFRGGYNIDTDPKGSNVCLIDSVGSQANRIEPLFKEERYKHLVPQIVVKAGEKEVNLLEAGHRAGDALVRSSALQKTLQDAFKASQRGDAELLAKITPTSLVFGVWDSRDTQEKRPRIVASTIRAFNVRELRRGAVYIPPVDYAALEVFSEEEKAKAEGDAKNPLAKRGFVHVPASGTHGGVIADGGIRRDAILGLAALRLLHAGKDTRKTLRLRRYILGLALVSFTHTPSAYLRQGCHLVRNPAKANENEFVEVYPSGERKPVAISHDNALGYATVAAREFGVGTDFEKLYGSDDAKVGVVERAPTGNRSEFVTLTVEFEKELAKKDVKGEGDTKTKPKKGARAKGKSGEPTDDK
jgi:CRISPR-associated protein Csb1